MGAENTAELWFMIREALSPEYLYQYAFSGAVTMSILSPLLFGFSISARSGLSLWSSLKGDHGDVRQAWLQLIVVVFAYGLYLVLGYAFLEIVVNVWNSFGSFSNGGRSIEAIFYDAFAHAEQQDQSLWDIAKEGASFFLFIGAETCRLGYTFLSFALAYAHAILFMLLFITGPIIIPLAMLKQFDFTKGWAIGWKVVVFWPIFEVMLRTATQIPFMNVASIIENSTASGGSMKLVIFTSMILIYCLAGAIAVVVPFFTNALVTGAGVVASVVAPMVGGAVAATGVLGGAMKQGAQQGGGAMKSAAGAAVPEAAKTLMSNLNQKGPGILKNTLTSSELGKQMGQIGKDLKRSVSPITKPLAESTKSTATTLGKGLGIDTKQVANDVKGLRGEGGSENSTPNTSASKEKPVKQSPSIASKSAMGSAVTSAASSALTSPEGSEGGMGKPEPPKATGGHQSSPEPHTKTKKKSAAKEQAKRGAIVNQIKKAKKDK